MKISGNTILITGGGSGIGLELAKQLIAKNNVVVVCGRDLQKLKSASLQLPELVTVQCDITNEQSVDNMLDLINERGLSVNILVNNAAKANAYFLSPSAGAVEKALAEINTNYISVIRLTEKLLPKLIADPQAAIINITSVVAVVPGLIIPTYSASKAALHSYTQSLRLSLAKFPNVKVFEVMPPVVDTEFSKEIPSQNRMAPTNVASDIITGIESNTVEMHLGATRILFEMYKENSSVALATMNKLS